MAMPDFSQYLERFEGTCKRCGHVHDVLAGDVPTDRVCTQCKREPPGFAWVVDVQGWVHGDVDAAKAAKADVEAFMQNYIKIQPGAVVPVDYKVQVNIEERGANRTVKRDPANEQRAAIIDYPETLSADDRKNYEATYVDSGLVLDLNEPDRDVIEMREFEKKHSIKRVVVPDEINPFKAAK